MKKLIVSVMLAMATLFMVGGIAIAGPNSVPEVVVGTYNFNSDGYRVTVGYAPCGQNNDGNSQFYARVKKGGGWTTEIWALSIAGLDSGLQQLFGFGLTQEAIDTLNQDVATYTCTP